MWSAPGARVNASNTAVPRTPDAPTQDEAYQNTERGAGILQSSPVTMTFMGLITSPLIAIAPTRSRTHMIMTQCLTVHSTDIQYTCKSFESPEHDRPR